MSALPPPSLVAGALSGDDTDRERLARAWLPHVLRWCHRLGGPGVDAESAAHDALLVVLERLDRVASPEAFPSWVFGVTRGVVANHRRKAWLRRWVPGVLVDAFSSAESSHTLRGPEVSAERHEAGRRVWAALDRLPEAQREVLVLCELEERASSEVAVLTGVPVNTVKSRLRLAKVAFRQALESPPGSPHRAAEVA